MAGEVPEEKKWTHILLAEGEEGQQCLKTLEGQVTKKEKLKQVWITFKQSIEKSGSQWQYCDDDKYLTLEEEQVPP